MSIKTRYNMEKGLYIAYIEPSDATSKVILAIGDTFHETIAKAWHRAIIRIKKHKQYGKENK